ncbi:MAG: hypothetical protein QM589_18300 [Thermomicrobiales bacterium]
MSGRRGICRLLAILTALSLALGWLTSGTAAAQDDATPVVQPGDDASFTSAAEPIVLTINDGAGPLLLRTNTWYSVAVTGLDPSSGGTYFNIYYGSGCNAPIRGQDSYAPDSDGTVLLEVFSGGEGTKSYQMEQNGRVSNCVDVEWVNVTTIPEPSPSPTVAPPIDPLMLAIDVSQGGPSGFAVLSATGLDASALFVLDQYDGPDCTGPLFSSTQTPNADGTWSTTIPADQGAGKSFEIFQPDRTSNCVSYPAPPSATATATPTATATATVTPNETPASGTTTPSVTQTATATATATSTLTQTATATATATIVEETTTPTTPDDPTPTASGAPLPTQAPSVTPHISSVPSPTPPVMVVSGLPNTGAGSPTGVPAPLWFLAGAITMLLFVIALGRRRLQR